MYGQNGYILIDFNRNIGIHMGNNMGINMRNIFWGPGRFSIGCGSKFRAEVAYLEVGSSDLEPIHEKHVFR